MGQDFNHESRVCCNGRCSKTAIFMRFVQCFVMPKDGVPHMGVSHGNQGAVYLATQTAIYSNSKHIDIRHSFFIGFLFKGYISVSHVAIECQHANVLTMPLTRDSCVFHSQSIMGTLNPSRMGHGYHCNIMNVGNLMGLR